MSFIAVQSYLITKIVPKLPKLYTPLKLDTVEIVHTICQNCSTSPSARYLEDHFEIFCGIVFKIVKFVAAGKVLVYTGIQKTCV